MRRDVRHWCASHPGALRAVNEDSYLCRPRIGLFAVTDGVGGEGGGDVAARRVIQGLGTASDGLSPADRLVEVRGLLQRAHEELSVLECARGAAPATTVVVLMLEERHFACLWVGDSRAYLLRDGLMSRLTSDHSEVEELVRAGSITAAEAERHPSANVITRAVGGGLTLELDKIVGDIAGEDRFLLCSDGLFKAVDEPAIAAILSSDAETDIAKRLVAAALARRASDNVTAVVALL